MAYEELVMTCGIDDKNDGSKDEIVLDIRFSPHGHHCDHSFSHYHAHTPLHPFLLYHSSPICPQGHRFLVVGWHLALFDCLRWNVGRRRLSRVNREPLGELWLFWI
mmetsp:Transcript_32530/g.60136  ORF Transcript_32530/g.60136 Transcript_32530/m.60136 type:complete len:106 (+) Transcript_32530:105-422(+)